MAIRKVIHTSKPAMETPGQYNFDTELGSLMDVSITNQKEVYTIQSDNNINVENINSYPGLIWPYKGLTLEIEGIFLKNRHNYDTVNGECKIYIVDDILEPDLKNQDNGDDIDSYLTNSNKFIEIKWNSGDGNDDSSDNDIKLGKFGSSGADHWDTDNSTFSDLTLKNIPYLPNEGADVDSNQHEYLDSNPNDWSDNIRNDDNLNNSIHIVVKTSGTAEEAGYGNVDVRNNSYQLFTIPKKYFYDVIVNSKRLGVEYAQIKWGSPFDEITPGYYGSDGIIDYNLTKNVISGNWSAPSHYEDTVGTEEGEGEWLGMSIGDDKKSSAYKCTGLVIKIKSPDGDAYDLVNFPTNGFKSGWYDTSRAVELVDMDLTYPINYLGFHGFTSDNNEDGINDYQDLIDMESVFDFRPITYLHVDSDDSDIFGYDLQQFHKAGTGYQYTTAPTRAAINVRIASNELEWWPEYLDGFDDEGDQDLTSTNLSNFGNIKFMMVAIDWDAEDTDLDWDNVILNKFPVDINDYDLKNLDDLFVYTDVYDYTNDGILSISHEYNDAGIHTAKILVFSYVEHPDDSNLITPLRWKALSVKFNLGLDAAYVQDFSDLGGDEYTFLPWPYASPIISGISSRSKYSNSVTEILRENKFTEGEVVWESLTKYAYSNLPGKDIGETGDYLGKTDLSQIRYFTESYDMNDLLMLPDDGGFVKYDEWNEWYDFDNYPDNPKYPRNEIGEINSCVGLLFIEEDTNIPRKNSCILELNMDEVTGNGIHDSSGHYNSGILYGDYSLKKEDYDREITREDPAEISEIGNEDLGF